MQKKPRDVVVVRVSEQGDREEDNFHSPKAQLAKAKLWSKDQGNRVVNAFEEIDVSGKLPLARRPGLLRAIEMLAAGEADHIVVAYFRPAGAFSEGAAPGDRARRAGGRRDLRDRPRQADQRYGGDADEQQHDGCGVPVLRRADRREGQKAAQARVVACGVLPNSRISPGHVRGEDRVLVVERAKARIVVGGVHAP